MIENIELTSHLDQLFQKVCVSLQKQRNQLAEKIGISRQQFDVLCLIYEKGQMTMGELCKEIMSACSTATDLADKLEKAGYVERIRERRDRRVVRLNILPEGRKAIKDAIEQRQDHLKRIISTYDQAELTKIISVLETMAHKFERE
ncbi:regulatory protein MarR [Syntrophobotulus glycolicus DSM 8271]|uniref:Regulatory protein MarR n=1 Tax=Syntrophobotulus glycolicus (strain DSM 8271 / FlGlyR) TaxID=645991 RepID=F0SWL8_SYNGF|nr:MarR family transcriptional regulator [Syntrophobotulus glycolicus]ADY56858.1 regulatory protein MarR [Syntrophobotulus glycolicus DSM 8271]